MSITPILFNSLWAAAFATAFGIILTTPVRMLVACFVCGFAARCMRDALMGFGLGQNWSTVVAAAILVLVAEAISRRYRISPVVLVCSVLPLGSVVAMFYALFELLKMPALQGELLDVSVVAFSANFAKALTGTLAIALGLGVGIAVVRSLWPRHEASGP
jgi:uncharacterized membrane protein YjjB (DUF3815 family)